MKTSLRDQLERRMLNVCRVDWRYKSMGGQAVLDVLDEVPRFRDQCRLFELALSHFGLHVDSELKIEPSHYVSETSWDECDRLRREDTWKSIRPFLTFQRPVGQVTRKLWATFRDWEGDERVFGVGLALSVLAPYIQIPRSVSQLTRDDIDRVVGSEAAKMALVLCKEAMIAKLPTYQLAGLGLLALERASTRLEKVAVLSFLIAEGVEQAGSRVLGEMFSAIEIPPELAGIFHRLIGEENLQ